MSENRFRLADTMQMVDEEIIRQAGEEWQRQEKKRDGFGRSGAVKAACALLIMALGLGGMFHEQVSAAIKRIAEQIGEIFGFEEELAPYTEVIGISKTVNGLSVTLQDVILDNSRVIAFLTWDSEASGEEPITEEGRFARIAFVNSLTVDGKEIEGVADHCYDTGTPGEYVVAQYFEAGSLPEHMSEVELNINAYEGITDEDPEGTGGYFTYKFRVTKDELAKEVSTISLDSRIEAGEDLTFTIRELSSTKLSNRVSVQCEGDPRTWLEMKNFDGTTEEVENLDWCLYLKDQEGNQAWCPAILYDEKSGTLIFESEGGVIPAAKGDTIEIQLSRLGQDNLKDGPPYVGDAIRVKAE